MWESEVGAYRGWWSGLCLCLSRDIERNPGIVVDSMIAMLMSQKMIIGVIAHVNVPHVLQLTLYSDVFNEWGHILPFLVWLMILTNSIHW